MSSKIERSGVPSFIRKSFGVPEPYGLMIQPDVPTFPWPDSKPQVPTLFGHSSDIDPNAIPQGSSSVTLFDAVSGQMSSDRRRKANRGYARRFVLAARHTDDNGSKSLAQNGITEAQRMAGVADAMIADVRRDRTAFESNWETTEELSRQAQNANAVVEAHDRPRRLLSRFRPLSKEERVLAAGIAEALDARTLLDSEEVAKIVEEKRVFDALRTAALVEAKKSHPGISKKMRTARKTEIALRTSELWDAYQASDSSDSGSRLTASDTETTTDARVIALLPQIEARKKGVKNAAEKWDAKARDRELRRVRTYMNRVTPLEQQILKKETGLQPETKEEKWGRYGMAVLLNAGVQGVKDTASWAGGIAASSFDLLGVMHFDKPYEVVAAVVASYVLWGYGLRKSLKENWQRLETEGNSVSAIALAAYERAKILFPDQERRQKWRTALGYLATDLTQEVVYYIAGGVVWLAGNDTHAAELFIGGNLVALGTELGQAMISKRMRKPSQIQESHASVQSAVSEVRSDNKQANTQVPLISEESLANRVK